MLVLDVPEAVLAAEEEAIRAHTPDVWATVQAWGKLRRLRGDARGFDDLRVATAMFRKIFTEVSPERLNSWMTPGHMLLMAGDVTEGRTLIAQARQIAEADIRHRGPNVLDSGNLIESCFLLGDYPAAIEAYEAVAAKNAKKMSTLRAGKFAMAARAVLTDDTRPALEAAKACATSANGNRYHYTEGGPLSLWEATEFILNVAAEITGDVPPGLRPFGPR